MSESKPRVDTGRESPAMATPSLLSADTSRGSITAAEVSTPAACTICSMGLKHTRYDCLDKDRARLLSD